MCQVAERAGISIVTLHRIERGESSVSVGAVANVLFCLGLGGDLDLVARDDILGRKLQDAGISVKARAPRRIRLVSVGDDVNE